MSRGFQGIRKLTTGELLNIDINSTGIKRKLNFRGEIRWKNGNNISILKDSEYGVIFNYNSTINGNSKSYRYKVGIDYTSCNYGNERPWFICPHCGKRVGKLYLRYGYFRCRSCQDLNYSIQQEDKWDRMMESVDRKIYNVQEKLKTKKDIDNICCIEKPKGMHWRTYTKLTKKLGQLSHLRDGVFSGIAMQRFGCIF